MDDQNFYAPPQADINPNEFGPSAPQTVGDTLSNIINLYSSSFKVILPVALISAIANAFFQFLMIPGTEALESGGGIGALFFLSFLGSSSLGIYLFCVGFLRIVNFTRDGVASENYKEFSDAFGFLIPMATFYFIYIFATGLGMVLCLLPGVFISVLFLVGDIALVKERLGPIEALQRSFNLIWGNWWFTFGVCFICGLGLGIPIAAIQAGTEIVFPNTPMAAIAVSLVTGIFSFPFWIVFMSATYDALLTRSGPDSWQQTDGGLDAATMDADAPPSNQAW